MFDLPPPIVAAIIISSVTFLTVVINVFSTRAVRAQERGEKHQEWVKEKQIRDVEEIIPTLSGFLKDLSDVTQSLDGHQSLADFLLNLNFEGRQKYTSDSDVQASKAEVVKLLRENQEKLKEATHALHGLASMTEPWFDFHAKRLSIWFDAEDKVEQSLSSIGDKFKEYHLSIVRASGKIDSFFFQLSLRRGELTDKDIAESSQLRENFEKVLEGRRELNAAVLTLQKTLADRFKPSDFQSASLDGGLLVKIARWLEKKLRCILLLR